MANPAPLPLLNVLAGRVLVGSLPQVCIGDLLRPSDVKDAAQTFVDECLYRVGDGICHPPCFRSIQKD